MVAPRGRCEGPRGAARLMSGVRRDKVPRRGRAVAVGARVMRPLRSQSTVMGSSEYSGLRGAR